MQGILIFQGLSHSREGFFISLGQSCGHSQLGFFCTSIGVSIIFKLLPLRRFLGLTFTFLRVFSHKVSSLMAMIASIFVFVFSFTRYSGPLGGGAFVKFSFLESSSTGESSSSSSESTSQPGPSFTTVTARATSSWPIFASSSSVSGACDVWFVWPLCGFSLHVHSIQGFSQLIYSIGQ